MRVQNNLRRDFTQVPNDLINDASISRDARFLFVWLCSKPDDWKFYNEGVNKALGCKDDARRKYMKELYDKGWLFVTQNRKDDGSWGANDITLNAFPVLPVSDKNGCGKNTEAVKNGDGKNPTLNNNEVINNTNFINNNENSLLLFDKSNDLPPSLPELVLKYLNEKKGGSRGFEITSATNQSEIKARIKEKKYTLEDFKKVINYKVMEWGGDAKNRKYIRPETLFGKKFNGYLITAEENKDKVLNDGSQNFVEAAASENDLA